MTENKRFTLKGIDNFDYGIKVTDVIMDDGIELPQSTVCDLLNDLSTKNEQLKKELESFKPIIFESDGKPVTLYKKGDVE